MKITLDANTYFIHCQVTNPLEAKLVAKYVSCINFEVVSSKAEKNVYIAVMFQQIRLFYKLHKVSDRAEVDVE